MDEKMNPRDVAEGLLRYIKQREEDREIKSERLPVLLALTNEQLAVVRDALCAFWLTNGGGN